MQALLIDMNPRRLERTMIAWMNAGLQVTGSASIQVAETCLLRMPVDVLLIEKDSIGDALGDTIGMAEELNPNVITVVLTDDVNTDLDELPQHFGSIHAVIGPDIVPDMLARMGQSWLSQRNASVEPQSVSVQIADTEEIGVRLEDIHRSLIRTRPLVSDAPSNEPWMQRLRQFSTRRRMPDVATT